MRLSHVFFVVALLLCAATFGIAGSSPTVPKKPRVAVLEFDVQDGPYNLASVARDEVSSWLVNCGRFQPYNRAKLADILQEHRLALTGIVEPTTAVEIGKFTGVQIVVCGSVQSASSESSSSTDRKGRTSYSTVAKVILHCQAIDATDGSIWKEGSFDGTEVASGSVDSSPLFAKALRDAAENFVNQLVPPISGDVVKVVPEKDGGYFIVYLGSKDGVTERSEFRVEAKGEIIYDLEGKPIESERRLICLAHPIRDGVSEKTTKLAPGQWHGGLFPSWEEQRGRVSEIQRGMRVVAVPRKYN